MSGDRLIMTPDDPEFNFWLQGALPPDARSNPREGWHVIVDRESGVFQYVDHHRLDEYLGDGEWDEVMGEEKDDGTAGYGEDLEPEFPEMVWLPSP